MKPKLTLDNNTNQNLKDVRRNKPFSFLYPIIFFALLTLILVLAWEFFEYKFIDFPTADLGRYQQDIVAAFLLIIFIAFSFSFYYWKYTTTDHRYIKTAKVLSVIQIIFLGILISLFIFWSQSFKSLTKEFNTLADYLSSFNVKFLVKNNLNYLNEVVMSKNLYGALQDKQISSPTEFIYCLYGNLFQFRDPDNISRPVTNVAVINAIYPAKIISSSETFSIYQECPPLISEESLIKREVSYPQNLLSVKDYLLLGTFHSHPVIAGEVILFRKEKWHRCLLSSKDIFAFGYESILAQQPLKMISCLSPGQIFAYSTINPGQPIELILIDY